MSYVYAEYDNWNGGTDIFDVHLTVDARKLEDYTEEVRGEILKAFSDIVTPIDRLWIGKVVVIPSTVSSRPLI